MQIMLIHFYSVSLSFYFNTVLTVRWSWPYWYPTPLSDQKIRQKQSWLEQCCYVCKIRSSMVHKISQECRLTYLEDQLPLSPFMHVSPPLPIHRITLAGAETLDKAVGTCVSTLPNRSTPTAADFKISGNQHAFVCDFVVKLPRQKGAEVNASLSVIGDMCSMKLFASSDVTF